MDQKSTRWKSAMTYGLYLAIVLILYSVILYVGGLLTNTVLGYVNFALLIVGIYLTQLTYRNKELGGAISYGQAVGFGVIVAACVGFLTAIYTLVLYKFIDPGLLKEVQAAQEEILLARGMSEDQVEAAMAMSEKMMTPVIMAISGVFSYVLIGTIISLITSIFVKRQPNEDEFEQAMEEIKTEE